MLPLKLQNRRMMRRTRTASTLHGCFRTIMFSPVSRLCTISGDVADAEDQQEHGDLSVHFVLDGLAANATQEK